MPNLEIKTFTLRNADYVISNTNTFFDYTTRTTIGLEWTINWDNKADSATGNGDSPLSQDSIKVDGNLICTIGHGDGISIRRINDDGSITSVYANNTPKNSYAYYHTCAVDKVRDHFYFGNYVYADLGRVDYSDTSSISLETLSVAGNDLPCSQYGYSWTNGAEVAGDYLYLVPDDAVTSVAQRWLIPSESAENLYVVNRTYDGIRGHVYYDEANDRVQMQFRQDGMHWIITHPTATSSDAFEPTASAYQIRVDSFLGGNDAYIQGFIPDNDNPNHAYLTSYYGRWGFADIEACLSGSTNQPTNIRKGIRGGTTNRWLPFILYLEGMMIIPHPTFGSEMPLFRDYAGYGGNSIGWLDTENLLPVIPSVTGVYGMAKKGTTLTETVRPSNALDLGRPTLPRPYSKVRASGGTEYWVISGYGGDHAGQIITYAAADFPNFLELHTNGNIVFGTFEFNSGRDITSIQICNIREGVFIPSDTGFKCYVSNNEGATWEAYGWRNENPHSFASTGNKAQVKFSFRGNGKRGSYIFTLRALMVVIRGTDEGERKSGKNYTLDKLQGL